MRANTVQEPTHKVFSKTVETVLFLCFTECYRERWIGVLRKLFILYFLTVSTVLRLFPGSYKTIYGLRLLAGVITAPH